MPECHSCRLNADIDALPAWERAYLSDDWRLAHASSALPGHMVLSPRRHVEALDELPAREAAALGPLLAATTAALRVVGCQKTYVMALTCASACSKTLALGDADRRLDQVDALAHVR